MATASIQERLQVLVNGLLGSIQFDREAISTIQIVCQLWARIRRRRLL